MIKKKIKKIIRKTDPVKVNKVKKKKVVEIKMINSLFKVENSIKL